MKINMTLKQCKSLALLGAITLLASCGAPKRYAYLQDIELAKQYMVEHSQNITIKPQDRVAIVVASSYPELVRPFMGLGFDTSVPGLGGVSSTTGLTNQIGGVAQSSGYLVDDQGYINYPVLGRISVGGMTPDQLARHIEQRIIESKYVPDPRVDVTISNFQIFLLGAKGTTGTQTTNLSSNSNYYAQATFNMISGIDGGILRVYNRKSLNVLEALAYMGDLPVNANIEKVNVLRMIDGKYVAHRLNLKETSIFNSPFFYLQQNDIVYVEARYRTTEWETFQNVLQVTGFITSTVSALTTLYLLSRSIK